jgi:phosphate transport system protein
MTIMGKDPQAISRTMRLLFVSKYLERIGDHATNIAEIVRYQITGEEADLVRPKTDALQV